MTALGLRWALLLALLGAAAGYGLAGLLRDAPAAIDAAPLAASSPSFPTDPTVEVSPDPGFPALEPPLRVKPERVGSKAFGVTVPAPDGWERTDTDLVESKWAPPGAPLNTYLLRVKIVSGQRLTIDRALEQRRSALESVVTQFDLEYQTSSTFVATYVHDHYRRLAMERFLSLDGSDNAFVTIAVIGRLSDRAGLNDLLERVSAGARR